MQRAGAVESEADRLGTTFLVSTRTHCGLLFPPELLSLNYFTHTYTHTLSLFKFPELFVTAIPSLFFSKLNYWIQFLRHCFKLLPINSVSKIERFLAKYPLRKMPSRKSTAGIHSGHVSYPCHLTLHAFVVRVFSDTLPFYSLFKFSPCTFITHYKERNSSHVNP